LSVLQILCLDLLTDQLPALALGMEPASPRSMEGRPARRHLIDAGLLVRAFGVLGPAESLLEMAAFVAVLLDFGWRPGHGLPTPGVLAVASGTAFVAIVAGQSAVALACRSTSRPFYRIPLRSNPWVPAALIVTWLLVAVLLEVPWVAGQ